jgi:hypothetical protein
MPVWWRVPLALGAAVACLVLTIGAARWLRDLLAERRGFRQDHQLPSDRDDFYSRWVPATFYWQTVIGLILVTPLLAAAVVLLPAYVLTR